MFGLVLYVGACLIVASFVTMVHSMMRPIHSKGESRSWRVLIFVFALCIFAPYGYVEVLTRSFGKPLKQAIDQGYADSGINGPLQYYKVVKYGGEEARVVAVGLEKQDWGGSDRPVVAMTLKKKGGGWTADSYTIVYSDRLQRDRSTLPPFW
jgi:hypothetical protein